VDKTTFKEPITPIFLRSRMTYTATRPTKEQVKRAIEGTLKDNAKLYELLAKYDEKNHKRLRRKMNKIK
jgi:hypothetical protein